MDNKHSGIMSWINGRFKDTDFEEQKLIDSLPEKTDHETLKHEFGVRHHWLIGRMCDPFILEDGSYSVWSIEELELARIKGIDLATYKTANEMNDVRNLLLRKGD